MKHRKVTAVMTPADQVVSVHTGAGYKEIAGMLAGHRISGVPVLNDASTVVGVVSEADLLAKESWLEGGERHFAGSRVRAAQAKAAGHTAADLMTSPAITVGPEEDVVRAARLMELHHVKRLQVTDERNRLLGMVTRRDILRLFTRPDGEILDEILEQVLVKTLWVDPESVEVTVTDGVVRLGGEVETRGLAELLCSLVRRTDGVVDVVDGLRFAADESETEPSQGQIHGVLDFWRRR